MSLAATEQSKDDFMTACIADGVAKDVCEARWKAAQESNEGVAEPAQSPGDAKLLNQIEMLNARVALREKQLKQAIGIANRANDERKAKEEAEKQSLIQSIQIDGKFSKEELDKKSLSELTTMRFTLDRSIEKTFVNVAAEIDEARRQHKPHLTAGYYDSATETWKGGN